MPTHVARLGCRFSVPLLVVLLLAAPDSALADATVIIQLRTSLAPVSEVASTRAWLALTGSPDQGGVSQAYVVESGDDLASGKRVAEYKILAPGGVTDIAIEGTLEIFGPGDVFLGGRPWTVTIENGTVHVLTLLIEPACEAIASCISSPFYSCMRTFYTTDGEPPTLCPPGMAAAGLRCDGGWCDNVRLDCAPVAGGMGAAERWTPFFSDGDGLQGCFGSELITGLDCSGNFCDDIALRCTEVNATLIDCALGPPVSEERNTPYRAGPDRFLRRIRCSGDFCDDKTPEVCEIRERVWTLADCASRCLSAPDFPGTEVFAGSGLELGACREASKNEDQRWRLTSSGWIANADLGFCLVPGGQNEPPELAPCDGGPSWRTDGSGRVTSALDPDQCLSVGTPGEPGEPPTLGNGLLLVPCEGGSGEKFALPEEVLPIPLLFAGALLLFGTLLAFEASRRARH